MNVEGKINMWQRIDKTGKMISFLCGPSSKRRSNRRKECKVSVKLKQDLRSN